MDTEKVKKRNCAVFLASLAASSSAIKTGDDGMRVTLDIPESEIVNALPLIAMRHSVLKIEVSVVNDEEVKIKLPKSSRISVNNTEDH